MERNETNLTKKVEDLKKALEILESIDISTFKIEDFESYEKEIETMIAYVQKIPALYEKIWGINKLKVVDVIIKGKRGNIEDFYKLCSKKMAQDIKDLLNKNIKEVKRSSIEYHNQNVSIISIETEEGDKYTISPSIRSIYNAYTILGVNSCLKIASKDTIFYINLEESIINNISHKKI